MFFLIKKPECGKQRYLKKRRFGILKDFYYQLGHVLIGVIADLLPGRSFNKFDVFLAYLIELNELLDIFGDFFIFSTFIP